LYYCYNKKGEVLRKYLGKTIQEQEKNLGTFNEVVGKIARRDIENE
jgi:hypothetical protein